jgi:rod shape determining protein RodA
VLAWNLALADYQKAACSLFLNPYRTSGAVVQYPAGLDGHRIGRMAGQGFGQSTQSQLHFLPVRHSDFIFAVICEELGWDRA